MRKPPKKDIITAALFLIVAAALGFAGFWSWTEYISTPPYVDTNRYPVRGIDISSHNGNIDFKKVKDSGYEFVFIKATEGGDYKDANFKTNYREAGHVGIKRGAYHFFRFDRDGVDQALNFIRTVGKHKLELGLAIDVEEEGNATGIPEDTIKERLQTMIDFLNLMGYRITLYTNIQGYEKYLLNTFAGQPLWICSFSSTPVDAEWTYWQYDHHGRVPGVEGDVDLNAFYGSTTDWENVCQQNKR